MNDSAHSAEVNRESFSVEVLDRSHQTPVLADFWAAWCAPCRTLMPVLAKLAGEYTGRFFLAKINSDQEQELAARYGVRSLPTVKLFMNGQVVDEFMGALPEKAVRTFLDKHLPRASDEQVAQAGEAVRAGRMDEALALVRSAVEADPRNDRARVALVRLLLQRREIDEAVRALDGLTPDARESTEAAQLRAELEFARVLITARSMDELREAVRRDASDCAARYELAAHLVMRQQYPEALDRLLEIVRQDRRWRDDAARKAILSVFSLLGGSGDVVNTYRRQLSMALN